MSALSLISVESPQHYSLSPPRSVVHRHPNRLFFKSRRFFQPFSVKLILPNFMAHSESRASDLAQLDCQENGGPTETVNSKYTETETVNSKYTEIIVIRHGETEWNAYRRIQGHLDVDLNDVGRQQAVSVADRLSQEPKISAVYSSDLKRALYTAEIIAERCGVLEVVTDVSLRERHLGDLQGVVFHEAAKVNPVAHKAFVSNREDQEIPGGGESFKQLYERCTAALDRIAKKHGGERVVVVSHGGTIRALHRRASSRDRTCGRILNTSVNVFHVSSDEGEWSIKSWGDVSHLNQTGFLKSGFGGDRNSG